mmetsp:Transcript_35642/g.114714  ORF Transcript_35642/g.114714 Transcript_35642/m.114714 type:complete len:342 (-) Transcript_35642:755-1780(-)
MGDGGGTVPYIGSRIVLISKSEIRYEGTLGAVDTAASTVKLHQVRSFGTEDRKADSVIPASSQVYEYIIFRGADIKDLHVCETGSDSASAPQPPAASSATSAPDPTPEPVAAAKPPAAPVAAWGANPSQARTAANPPAPAATPRAQQSTSKPRGGWSQPGMPKAAASGRAPEAEFDIQAMLESFDKAFVMQEASEKVKPSTAYNKSSSFFDTLDEEANDPGRKGGPVFRAQMRKNDVLTFGEDMLKEADRVARSRGGSRGRGTGGKGGGKGYEGGRGDGDRRPGKGGKGDGRAGCKGDGKGGERRGKGDGRGRGDGGGRGRGRGVGGGGSSGPAPVPVAVS